MSAFQLSYAMLWALVLILLPTSAVLLYQYAHIQRALDREKGSNETRIQSGVELPDLSGRDLKTGRISSLGDWRGSPFRLLVLSSSCRSCKLLADELGKIQTDDFRKSQFVIVLCGQEGLSFELPHLALVPELVVDAASQEAAPFMLLGLPVAISLDEHGIITDIVHPQSLEDLRTFVLEGSSVSQSEGAERPSSY